MAEVNVTTRGGCAMISELRRRKFRAVFDRVDANDNGVLEREDFLIVAAKFVEQSGWTEDSAQAHGMRDLFVAWWESISGAADADKDGVITADEFVTGAGALDRDASAAAGAMLFDAFDRSGDGLISPAEYRAFLSIYGVDAAQADEIFARIDSDGDGHVTRVEFASLFVDYVAGEDEAAPGNWLFGPY